MSETAVFQALKSTGYPVHLLGAHDDSSLPRISYSFPSAPGFFADSRTYRPMERCEVRLYTDQYPDEAAESAVETAIGRLGFALREAPRADSKRTNARDNVHVHRP